MICTRKRQSWESWEQQQVWQQPDLPSSAIEAEVCWNGQIPLGAHVCVQKHQLACTIQSAVPAVVLHRQQLANKYAFHAHVHRQIACTTAACALASLLPSLNSLKGAHSMLCHKTCCISKLLKIFTTSEALHELLEHLCQQSIRAQFWRGNVHICHVHG